MFNNIEPGLGVVCHKVAKATEIVSASHCSQFIGLNVWLTLRIHSRIASLKSDDVIA